jgi:DNA-binding transcriptional regulator YiaG
MPNIASILKEEISRIARKEIRGEIASLKTLTIAQRSEISALKRRTADIEKALRVLIKTHAKATSQTRATESTKPTRFSAKGLASHRKRLGLSAEDCGLLVGTSGQSVYNWESGKARPRDSHLAAIAELKSLGKREVARRLTAAKGRGTD